jgi:energy-converting hydrogenase A subunit M
MDDEAKLELMKDRIVKTYVCQRDIIKPLSEDFDCTTDELEHVFFERLDMSQLLAFHATFETSHYECLLMKLHADLRLCWIIGTLELITREEGEDLKERLAQKIMDGQDYSDVLKEGQKELFALIKNSK